MGVQVFGEGRPWRGRREMVLLPEVIRAMRGVWYVWFRAGVMVRRVRRVVVKVDLGREKRVVVVVVRVASVWPGVVGVWERLMVRSLVRWISVVMVVLVW